MKLSIVIPCYNVEKYINRCYESLKVQQISSDVEFIFINDGSSDNTKALLENIQSEDSRVVVISQTNGGVSSARNRALEEAKGDFIYLLDSDDYLTANALNSIIKVLDENSPDIIISAYNVIYNNQERTVFIPLSNGIYSKTELYKNISSFPLATKLVYRSDIIKKYGLHFSTSIRCGEVYSFTINFLKYAESIFVLNVPIFNYYMRDDSAIHCSNYLNDMTVLNALSSVYGNAGELCKYGSFVVTAFKLLTSFSYNKYLKNCYDIESLKIIDSIFSNDISKRCVRDTLLKSHNLIKERLMALYIFVMPRKAGFRILKYFVDLKNNL